MTEEILSAEEVGHRLGVQAETVRRWARQNKIPHVRIGSKILRFNWTDVWAVLEKKGAAK